jgi:hypothetical protein
MALKDKRIAELMGKQPTSSQQEPDSSHIESPQAEKPHLARDYEKVCVDCGGENPNFKGKPNVFCGAKGCDGKIPMGYVPPAEMEVLKDGKPHDLPNVGRCFNCGSDHDAIVVVE